MPDHGRDGEPNFNVRIPDLLLLFLDRSFDQVSVAEIAAAAEVAEKTVYNHFRTKAHLVFDEDPDLLAGILDAVRDRAPGQSALEALRAYLPAQANRLGQSQPAAHGAAFRRMVLASPILREHQRAMAARYEIALAGVLAEATGTDADAPEPFIAAIALIGALRAGFETSPQAGGVAEPWAEPWTCSRAWPITPPTAVMSSQPVLQNPHRGPDHDRRDIARPERSRSLRPARTARHAPGCGAIRRRTPGRGCAG